MKPNYEDEFKKNICNKAEIENPKNKCDTCLFTIYYRIIGNNHIGADCGYNLIKKYMPELIYMIEEKYIKDSQMKPKEFLYDLLKKTFPDINIQDIVEGCCPKSFGDYIDNSDEEFKELQCEPQHPKICLECFRTSFLNC